LNATRIFLKSGETLRKFRDDLVLLNASLSYRVLGLKMGEEQLDKAVESRSILDKVPQSLFRVPDMPPDMPPDSSKDRTSSSTKSGGQGPRHGPRFPRSTSKSESTSTGLLLEPTPFGPHMIRGRTDFIAFDSDEKKPGDFLKQLDYFRRILNRICQGRGPMFELAQRVYGSREYASLRNKILSRLSKMVKEMGMVNAYLEEKVLTGLERFPDTILRIPPWMEKFRAKVLLKHRGGSAATTRVNRATTRVSHSSSNGSSSSSSQDSACSGFLYQVKTFCRALAEIKGLGGPKLDRARQRLSLEDFESLESQINERLVSIQDDLTFVNAALRFQSLGDGMSPKKVEIRVMAMQVLKNFPDGLFLIPGYAQRYHPFFKVKSTQHVGGQRPPQETRAHPMRRESIRQPHDSHRSQKHGPRSQPVRLVENLRSFYRNIRDLCHMNGTLFHEAKEQYTEEEFQELREEVARRIEAMQVDVIALNRYLRTRVLGYDKSLHELDMELDQRRFSLQPKLFNITDAQRSLIRDIEKQRGGSSHSGK
jgi:hypothetical protein